MNEDAGKLLLEYNCELTQSQWKMYRNVVRRRILEETSFKLMLTLFSAIIMAGIFIAVMVMKSEAGSFHAPTIIVSFLIFLGVALEFLFILSRLRQRYINKKKSIFSGKHCFSFYENTMVVESNNYKNIYRMDSIKEIYFVNGDLLVLIDFSFGYLIPRSDVLDKDIVKSKLHHLVPYRK